MEDSAVYANPQQLYQALQAFWTFALQLELEQQYQLMLLLKKLQRMTILNKNQIVQILSLLYSMSFLEICEC